MDRRAREVALELRRGLWFVRASTTAVGLGGWLVTLFAVIGSFVGCGCSKSAWMAAVTEQLSVAGVPAATGLFLAILLKLGHDHLAAEANELEGHLQVS